jgi:outer membrane protein assembly factor BamB
MSAIRTVLLIGIIFLAAANSAFSELSADDWPQWRGPDRSNTSRETGLLTQWPTNGPPLVWKVTGLGEGITSVSVAGGRVFTVGNLAVSEFVFALDTKTGEKVWATRVGASIQEQALLRTSDGQKLWQRNYTNDFGSRRPMWGFCDRPLVDSDKLICTPVGTEATIVALNKRTGELLWKTTLAGEQAQGYAALIVSEAGGIRQYVAFLAKGLIGVAATDGRLLWRYDRPNTRTASSYTPLVRGDLLCSPNGYGGGIVLIKLSNDGETMKVEHIYHESCNLDPFQDSTALVGEHLYTVRTTGLPACIDFKTGKLVWDQRPTSGSGRAALTYADGHLYLRYANGTTTLVEATPRRTSRKVPFRFPSTSSQSV